MNALVRELLAALEVDVPVVHDTPRAGDVRRHCGGIDLAQALFGYSPITSLREGLVETVAWYRASLVPG